MPANADDLGTAHDALDDRVDSIASWLGDLDTRVRATELATSDERTAKELRRAIEALSKHDPKLEKRLTDRVDVLSDRLATLASTLSTTAASLARKDGEIAALRKDLESGTKRIESLSREQTKSGIAEELERLRSAVRTVQTDRPARAGEARIADLATKVNFLAERVDTLGQTVATTAAGLAGRDGELATLRQRLEESSTRIERTAVELRRVEDRDSAPALEELRGVVDATSARLAVREDEIAAVRARIDEAYARIGTVVTELQASIAALSTQVTALETLPAATGEALDARTAEIDARLDGLVESLSGLAARAETSAEALAARELENASLTRRVDEVGERLGTLADELRGELAELPQAGTIDPAVEARLEALSGSVAELGERLVAASAERTEATELHSSLLAEMTARLDKAEGGQAAAAAELARVGAELEGEREATHGRLERVEGAQSAVAADVASLTANLEAEREALVAARSEAADATDRYESLLAEVTVRFDAIESGNAAGAAEVARVAADLERQREAMSGRLEFLEGRQAALGADTTRLGEALESEHEVLGARIDGLEAALSAATGHSGNDEVEEALSRLESRIAGLEDGSEAVAREVEKKAAIWSSELDAIGARLAEATGSISEDVTRGYVETRRLVAELADRLDSLEREPGGVAHEAARSSASWEAERDELAGRIDEVAARLAELGSAAPAAPAGTASEDLDQLRVSLEGLRMRLASHEQELAALVGERDAGSRVEELARRLDALERAPVVITGAADGSPVPGDGRFRVELRALELRAEVAEATARESREAVLVQLERLAARVDWRFQRLEAELEAYAPEEATGGRVVPIRPEL